MPLAGGPLPLAVLMVFLLYGWKADAKPGDVTGQNVNGFTLAKP